MSSSSNVRRPWPPAGPATTGAHIVSVGYLALRACRKRAGCKPPARFEPWYRFFPWEDWRDERPAIIDADHPALTRWAAQRRRRAARALPRATRAAILRGRRRALGRGAGARPPRAPLRGRAWSRRHGATAALRHWRARRFRRSARPCDLITAAFSRPPSRGCARNSSTAPVVFELMPREFTLTELQHTVEAILAGTCTSKISAASWKPKPWSNRPG